MRQTPLEQSIALFILNWTTAGRLDHLKRWVYESQRKGKPKPSPTLVMFHELILHHILNKTATLEVQPDWQVPLATVLAEENILTMCGLARLQSNQGHFYYAVNLRHSCWTGICISFAKWVRRHFKKWCPLTLSGESKYPHSFQYSICYRQYLPASLQ